MQISKPTFDSDEQFYKEVKSGYSGAENNYVVDSGNGLGTEESSDFGPVLGYIDGENPLREPELHFRDTYGPEYETGIAQNHDLVDLFQFSDGHINDIQDDYHSSHFGEIEIIGSVPNEETIHYTDIYLPEYEDPGSQLVGAEFGHGAQFGLKDTQIAGMQIGPQGEFYQDEDDVYIQGSNYNRETFYGNDPLAGLPYMTPDEVLEPLLKNETGFQSSIGEYPLAGLPTMKHDEVQEPFPKVETGFQSVNYVPRNPVVPILLFAVLLTAYTYFRNSVFFNSGARGRSRRYPSRR